MVYRRRVRAAISITAAFIGSGVFLWTGPPGWADEDDQRSILFSGRDIWRNGAFAYGGLLVTPGDLEQDGFMLKLLLSGGLYRYTADNLNGEQVIGGDWLAQVLPGFRIKRGKAELKFFFGPELQRHKSWPEDPDNRLRGQSFGLLMAGELWYEPTYATMIAANASMSSIATSHSARAGIGWRVAGEILNGDGFYLGPEVQYFGADGYRQLRLGVHITSMKTGKTEWFAAGGWATDSEGRSSPYLRLGVSSRH
jgi:hypothetical protein